MDDVAQGIFYRLLEEDVPLLEPNAKARSAFTDARKDEAAVGICKSIGGESIAMNPPFQVWRWFSLPFSGAVVYLVGVDCLGWRYGCGEVELWLNNPSPTNRLRHRFRILGEQDSQLWWARFTPRFTAWLTTFGRETA